MSDYLANQIKSLKRNALFAVVLAPVFVAIFFGAFLLRFDGRLGDSEQQRFATFVGWLVLAKTIAFAHAKAFRGWSRCVSFHDLIVLGKAATIGSLLLVLFDVFLLTSHSVPRSILLMDWAVTILAVGAMRSTVRMVVERHLPGFRPLDTTSVFIVGTNHSGETLLRSIKRNSNLSYHVVGFITDDAGLLGSHVEGVPILGTLDATCRLAQKHQVSNVLITAGDLPGQRVRELVQHASARDIQVKVLPSYEQLLGGTVDLRPREVAIEDLLCRDPVELNLAELHSWIQDRVLLVTGSSGSIGSEICRQLLQFNPRKLVLVDRSENGQFFLERELRQQYPDAPLEVCMADINDAARISKLFNLHEPEIVFHAAAYKHVPMMEANPGEAVKNITIATRMLADIAHQHQVESFVMISTDKAVNPTSVMGTCKRLAELYIQALADQSQTRFVTVRFGNVLDSAGSVVPIFREQIARGGPVTITHPDMRRYFMTIPEASQLVIQAGAMGQGGEIFVLDMGQPVQIVDLAKDMIRLSGLRIGDDIELEFIGLRPGEKMYEELNAEGEQHLKTSHPKIQVAKSTPRVVSDVRKSIDALGRIAEGPAGAIRTGLQRFVPEYSGHQTQREITKAA